MNKIIKKIYSIILFCSSILLMSSCTTTGSYFTENQQRENNRKFMLQQQQQQEELAREMFRIKVNQALSITASSLTIELYNNLGRGEVAVNDFIKEHINYYYQNETADCPITIWWNRKRKKVVISGTLIYQNNGYVKFVCTNATGNRASDTKYIREMTKEGLYFRVQ